MLLGNARSGTAPFECHNTTAGGALLEHVEAKEPPAPAVLDSR
jgi:hypothetical protein